MYDLHCHILPFIDDGPATWEESLDLANRLANEGVRVVAATPHSYSFSRDNPYKPTSVLELVREAQTKFADRKIGLRLISGTEIRLSEYTLSLLESGRLLPYEGTQTILIESSTYANMAVLKDAITEIKSKGFQIILAHPEKIEEVQQNPSALIPFVQAGVAMQLTAANLIGKNGSQLEGLCEKLLMNGIGHLVASDAHSASGPRAPHMKTAYRKAKNLLGSEAEILFDQFPRQIVNGRQFPGFNPSAIS